MVQVSEPLAHILHRQPGLLTFKTGACSQQITPIAIYGDKDNLFGLGRVADKPV